MEFAQGAKQGMIHSMVWITFFYLLGVEEVCSWVTNKTNFVCNVETLHAYDGIGHQTCLSSGTAG